MGTPLDSVLKSMTYEGEIRDLETELDDMLCFIAYDDGAKDRNYIIKRAKEIEDKYTHFVERLGGRWEKLESELGLTIFSIRSAFYEFIWLAEEIKEKTYTEKEIRQNAENIKGEFLNYDSDIANVAYAYQTPNLSFMQE